MKLSSVLRHTSHPHPTFTNCKNETARIPVTLIAAKDHLKCLQTWSKHPKRQVMSCASHLLWRTMEITPNILYYDGRQSCLSDRQIVSSYGRRMVQATSQLMCVKCLGPFRDTIPLFYRAIISLTIHRAPSTLHNTPASGREI